MLSTARMAGHSFGSMWRIAGSDLVFIDLIVEKPEFIARNKARMWQWVWAAGGTKIDFEKLWKSEEG